jgi:enoyl-CoA hydratase/carnithine racemase
MSTLVLREDHDGLATLTLNRPEKLNALTVALFAELRAHVLQLAHETEHIGLVVLRGAGKCFSAGHDLADIAHGEKPPMPHFQADTIELLANLPQPVVCAVHGHCYTGALELALAGDMVVAAESAKFADTHARWALTPVWGMSQRLPRRVGMAKAQEMTYTARTYSGREAEAMGLVNWCVPDAGFDAAVSGMARGILANSWFSLRANKRLYRETEGLPLRAGLSHEIHRSEGRGPDMDTRIAAFMNKTSKLS